MSKYLVTESIHRLKTNSIMVKNISGYCYIYEYKSIKGNYCKSRAQMGKLIGSIKPDIRFVPGSSQSY